MGKVLASLLLAAYAIGATAFVAPNRIRSSALASEKLRSFHNEAFPVSLSRTSLSLSSSPDENNRRCGVFPKARTDVRNFLTQRSIQSFIYLLNQCREEHTVRWLEKTLDFSSLDNFHGTGAFNQTRFPEWDSIFLDCVDRPEEEIVIEIRQRRRQRKLSGYNAYFESLKSPAPLEKKDQKVGTRPTKNTRAFSTARNYLDAMNATTDRTDSVAKKSQSPTKTSRRLSSSNNYLDNLSSSVPLEILEPTSLKPVEKDDSKKSNETKLLVKGTKEKNSTVLSEKDKSEDTKKASIKAKNKPTERRTFSPGKSVSYLESLSKQSKDVKSGEVGKEAVEEIKPTKQSTETSDNPFLEEKTQEYKLSIDPPALVRRILAVREQLSKEWVEDLDMLTKLNDEITEYFEEYNKKDGDDEDCKSSDRKAPKKDSGDRNYDGGSDGLETFMEALVPPAEGDCDSDVSSTPSDVFFDSNEEKATLKKGKSESLFDRSILNTWSQLLWSPKRSSSPYRKANFDLLLLLATQESIHRVLVSYENDSSVRPEIHEWLLDFYKDNVNEYFDGHQTYARGEDFLEEMMKSPRTLIETNNDIIAWIDPAQVAEDIVRERSEVTLDWMRVAKTISDEHTDLRRVLFTNMVSKSFPDESSLSDTILTAMKKEAKKDSTRSPTEVFGAFE